MATAAAARHQQHQQRRGAQRGRRRGSGIRCSSPAQEFASLAAVFRRRLVVGATTAAAAAVGANFGGVTSFLLGLSPELGRSLRLDVLYPVGGFTRCLDSDNGFGKRPPPPPPPTPLFHLPLPPHTSCSAVQSSQLPSACAGTARLRFPKQSSSTLKLNSRAITLLAIVFDESAGRGERARGVPSPSLLSSWLL